MGRQIDIVLSNIRKMINEYRSLEYFLETHDLTDEEMEAYKIHINNHNVRELRKLFSEKDLTNLESKPVNVLKAIAQQNYIQHWSRMSKADLIRAIKETICVSK